jgi:hypothetical protein
MAVGVGVGPFARGRRGAAPPPAPVSPPAAPASFAASAGALNALTATTLAVTVPAASNRILIVTAAMPASPNGGTITGVALDGVAMTLLDARDMADATRRNYLSIWYLLAPKVGVGVVTVTRTPAPGFEATTTRLLASAFTLTNAFQAAPDVLGALQQPADQGAYALSATPLADDTALIGIASAELLSATNTTPTTNLDAGDTLIGEQRPSGATPYVSITHRAVDTPVPDTLSLTLSGTSPTARNAIVLAIGVRGVAAQQYLPIYYVANEGSDAADGLSEATAVKTLAPLFGALGGGGEIRLKAGQRHRAQSFGAGRDLLNLSAGGAPGSPIRIMGYGAGARPIMDGSVIEAGWSAVSAGEAYNNGNSASLVKMTSPPALHRNQFPVAGASMLYPAQWPAPSANAGVDDAERGFDAFHSYDAATYAARVSVAGSNPYTVTITDPAIAARYGAASPAGYGAVMRINGNLTLEVPITGYDQGASSITVVVPGANGPFAPTSSADFYWAIRFHPLDIVRPGQYAWLLDGGANLINLCGWFPAGERAVTHCRSGFLADVEHVVIDGVDLERFAAVPAETTNGAASAVLALSTGPRPKNLTVRNARVDQFYDPLRSSAFQFYGADIDTVLVEDVTFGENMWTQGGVRCVGLSQGVFRRIDCGRLGRTSIYLAKPGSTVEDVDCSDNISVHGNGVTTYEDSQGAVISNIGALGNTNSFTSQVGSWTSAYSKSARWTNCIGTAARRPDGSSPTAWVGRFDGGDTDTIWERMLAIGGNSGGVTFSTAAGPNTGAVVRRSIIDGLGSTGTGPFGQGVAGVTFDRCLITRAISGATSVADLTAKGATCIDVEVDPSEAWTGCLSPKMWRYLSWLSGPAGAAIYEPVQIGPTQWGWALPAYAAGAPGALVDLGLTRTSVPAGHGAGKTIGSVIRTRAGSTLTLPAGAGDNALFGLDKGQAFPLAALAAGTRTLVVRETNAGASNGPARDTAITIAVG